MRARVYPIFTHTDYFYAMQFFNTRTEQQMSAKSTLQLLHVKAAVKAGKINRIVTLYNYSRNAFY